MNQAGGTEGMSGPLVLKLPVGDAAQLVVDQREQSIHYLWPIPKLEQEVGDLAIALGRRLRKVQCRGDLRGESPATK